MRALITPSLVASLALAGLTTACSDGALDRADGPPTFDGNSNTPYTPPMPNPGEVVNPMGQTPTGQTPSTGNENEDDDVPLDPNPPATSQLGVATMGGVGTTTQRYHKADVTRDGKNYFLMANGWGPGFQSQSLARAVSVLRISA
jgi:hypothetical protein